MPRDSATLASPRPEAPQATADELTPSMTVRLARVGAHGPCVIFPKADRRTRGPKMHAKIVRTIIAELPERRRPPSTATKHFVDRLAMLRVTVEALHEARLRGEEIDTGLLLGAVIAEMKLARQLGLQPFAPSGDTPVKTNS